MQGHTDTLKMDDMPFKRIYSGTASAEADEAGLTVPPGCNLDENGRIAGPPTKDMKIRYHLMSFHTILVVLTTVFLAALATDLINAVIGLALTVGLIIYVPAAAILTRRRSTSRFQQAWVEVMYVSFQIAGWTASGILDVISLSLNRCETSRTANPEIDSSATGSGSDTGPAVGVVRHSFCGWVGVALGLTIYHIIILVAWMVRVILLVRASSPSDRKAGFRVSVGWLMRGWKA